MTQRLSKGFRANSAAVTSRVFSYRGALDGSARLRGAVGGAKRPPRPTGFRPRAVTTGGKSRNVATVDWLNVTYDHDRSFECVIEALSEAMGGIPVGGRGMQGGRYGFEHGLKVSVYARGQMHEVGDFSWGGEGQRGRALLQLTGSGCQMVSDWAFLAEWIGSLPNYRLTRVDLAVDLHDGDYSVDDAATWALEGRMVNGGHPPQCETHGDWLNQEHGRTLYVGKSVHGKMLRVYEKGKQLGDLTSPWVRWEVQFGNKHRVLPLEMLTERDKFFAAAYPALEEILGIVGEKIKTVRECTRLSFSKAIEHLKRSYGKWLHAGLESGVDAVDLVEAVRVCAYPPRFNAASIADAGFADAVCSALSRKESGP